MKNKMEITISVCVGSSIVSFGLYLSKSFSEFHLSKLRLSSSHCLSLLAGCELYHVSLGYYHIYLPIVLVTTSHYILPILRYSIRTTVPRCVLTLYRLLFSSLL